MTSFGEPASISLLTCLQDESAARALAGHVRSALKQRSTTLLIDGRTPAREPSLDIPVLLATPALAEAWFSVRLAAPIARALNQRVVLALSVGGRIEIGAHLVEHEVRGRLDSPAASAGLAALLDQPLLASDCGFITAIIARGEVFVPQVEPDRFLKDFQDACMLLKRDNAVAAANAALQNMLRVLEQPHDVDPRAAMIRHATATAAFLQGKYDQAFAEMVASTRTRARGFSMQSAQWALSQQDVAACLLKMGRLAEAVTALAEARAVLEAHGRPVVLNIRAGNA